MPDQYLGRVRFRGDRRPFGILHEDRFSHVYVIGKTGTGKSTLLESLIRQDIEAGAGLTVVDPHGDLVEAIAAQIPPHRSDDVLFWNVPDPSQPYGYNPLKHVARDRRALAASGLLEVFQKTWDAKSWGSRMEHILRNALLTLLDQPAAVLPDISRLLVDRPFRELAMEQVENPAVRNFWLEEYAKYSPRFRADAIAPIQTKVGAFLADPLLYRILTDAKEPLHLRRLMDEGKVLLVNLAKGRLGEDSASLLGSLLVTTIGLAAMSRADQDASRRRDFFLYLDEFQSFTTRSLASMTSELRKYRVGLVLAHQYLAQLEPEIRHAVLGNAGTLILFRVGPEDAAFLSRELEPKLEASDLLSLPNHHVYLKLMIREAPSQPFSATTLLPEEALACWSSSMRGSGRTLI